MNHRAVSACAAFNNGTASHDPDSWKLEAERAAAIHLRMSGQPPGAQQAPDYEVPVRRYAAERVPEARLSTWLSRLRLATFLPGLACALWAVFRQSSVVVVLAAGVLLVAFAVLVVWHARVDVRIAWLDALVVVNQRALARVRREWNGLPAAQPPAHLDLTAHPFAADLDLFGHASLFQWLGPAATPAGSRALAGWLLTPAAPNEVGARQEAVAALATCDAWREQLAAHGIIAAATRHQELERFLAWAEGPPIFDGRLKLLQVTVLTITAAIWGLMLFSELGGTDSAPWLVPLAIGIVLSFAMARPIQDWLDRAGAGQQGLRRYAAILEHTVTAPTEGARLSDLHARLTVHGLRAPSCMRQLNRILGFGELRGVLLFHFPIQALTLWDFHVLFALERWRRRAGARVRDWLEAVGEIDALAQLAGASRDNPSWCVPHLSDAATIDAVGLGHPLLAGAQRIVNDVRVGPPGTVLLVTGSNMSGKSTLLRTIGLNVILAQAGGVAAAQRLSLPPCDLQTSLRVQDSLELGLSYFMAALARLKGVVDAAEQQPPARVLVYLLDEILQGTNSVERAIAVRGVARHLLQSGAIGAMTTHDLSIAGEEPLATAARLVHFTETVDDAGAMRFDYRLRPGLATSTNALRLMKLIGIEC